MYCTVQVFLQELSWKEKDKRTLLTDRTSQFGGHESQTRYLHTAAVRCHNFILLSESRSGRREVVCPHLPFQRGSHKSSARVRLAGLISNSFQEKKNGHRRGASGEGDA